MAWWKLAPWALLFICNTVAAAAEAEPNLLTANEMIKRLQTGGYIMYIRHGATDQSQSDMDLSDFGRCDLQRNLSDVGKLESRIMGDALQKLNIKVNDVYTSPYCRTVDTAKGVFGRYEKVDDLKATFTSDVEETAYLSKSLKKRLSVIPVKGSNTALIGHTGNLREAASVWPKPEGVVHVFKPLGKDGYQHIGHIVPTQWKRLAKLTK